MNVIPMHRDPHAASTARALRSLDRIGRPITVATIALMLVCARTQIAHARSSHSFGGSHFSTHTSTSHSFSSSHASSPMRSAPMRAAAPPTVRVARPAPRAVQVRPNPTRPVAAHPALRPRYAPGAARVRRASAANASSAHSPYRSPDACRTPEAGRWHVSPCPDRR